MKEDHTIFLAVAACLCSFIVSYLIGVLILYQDFHAMTNPYFGAQIYYSQIAAVVGVMVSIGYAYYAKQVIHHNLFKYLVNKSVKLGVLFGFVSTIILKIYFEVLDKLPSYAFLPYYQFRDYLITFVVCFVACFIPMVISGFILTKTGENSSSKS